MELPDNLLSWYGDDFTGSAAVMEVLTFAGLPSALCLGPPTLKQLERLNSVRGLGIAGVARAHSPAWMDENLPTIFDYLKLLDSPITHYKTCSTLDSSPTVGSIGKAVELAQSVFQSPWVPIFHAAPAVRRWQVFGNLFAGAPDGVFRLDRHPVMSRHPVTPMDEADVAAHLRKQTTKSIGLLDLEALSSPESAQTKLSQLLGDGCELISLDALDERTLAQVGRLIWENRPLFAAGSQGIEYALIAYWREAGWLPPAAEIPPAPRVERIVAISGSASAVTAAQIDYALKNGFVGIPIEVSAVLENADRAIDDAVARALAALAVGSPLLYTARGPSISRLDEAANDSLGEALGRMLENILLQSGVTRVVVSGGDTSGRVVRQLGLFALTAIAPITPGAALCRAWAHTRDFDAPGIARMRRFDGLEIALKGGQMGGPDYFVRVLQ